MKEIWKDIANYENIYEISNFGNIRLYKNKKKLKPNDDGKGYLQIILTKNKKRKCYKIHKLVALAFLPNTEKLPQINHKDENKYNNNVNNLEWCTFEYNMNYGTRNYRCTKHRSHKVNQYDLKNNFINSFNSLKEAQEKTNISYQSITSVCKNRQKTAGGYIWRYC